MIFLYNKYGPVWGKYNITDMTYDQDPGWLGLPSSGIWDIKNHGPFFLRFTGLGKHT